MNERDGIIYIPSVMMISVVIQAKNFRAYSVGITDDRYL
jgi:hypothetical protein